MNWLEVCLTVGSTAVDATSWTTDAHLHPLDFLQHGDDLESVRIVEKYPDNLMVSSDQVFAI